jgi:hypothetical protein
MAATLSLRARPQIEALERRELLDAKLPALNAVALATAQTRVMTSSPMQIDYGTALHAPGATPTATMTTIYSTVTIRNQTPSRVSYYISWPGSQQQLFTVEANSSMIHWMTGSNVAATISFDKSFATGYQDQTYNLTTRDFAGGGALSLRPSRNTDGMQYYFTRNSTNTGLNLYADVTLNKSALSQYRYGVNSDGSFPQLMSNFEVLAAPTRVYNCIANSLGYHDRWVNPITSSGSNKLAGMDQLYAAQGYQRMSTLDYSLRAGYQKVVVYAKVTNGVITEVTHAAIQMSDGAWSSKLGQNALIKHVLPDDLAGGLYGIPVAVYIRRA